MNFIFFQQQRLNNQCGKDAKEEVKDLEFLAQKSIFFIEKQVDSYRYKHTLCSSIITIIVLFIPFFINGLDKQNSVVLTLAIISLLLLVICLIYLIQILKIKSLDFGFNPHKLNELANYKDYQKVLLFEIGANKDSFESNMVIIEKVNKKFHFTIKLVLISVIFSIFTLIISNFTIMFENTNDDPKDSSPRVIPTVPPGDRINLNDPFDMPSRIKSIKDTLDK